MISLVARQNMKIAGKLVKVGETFEISNQYARTLLATRQAAKAPDKPKSTRTKKEEPESAEPEEKPKTYKTRRMKAEDSD